MWQTIVYVILKSVGFGVNAEVLTNEGRIDMTCETPACIWLVEFKLDRPAEEALAQIDARGLKVPGTCGMLTFDSKEMLDSGELPLCLYTGDFAGSVTVTTPVEGRLRWKVTKRTVNGVCGLYLERDPFGLAIFIR